MIKSVFAIIIFGLIALSLVVMGVIYFMFKGVKGFRKMREEAEEAMYRNQKRREQKEKNPFGDDYFKSSGSQGGKRAQTQYEQRPQQGAKRQTAQQQPQPSEEPQKDTARRTTTSSGVTIIDDRDTEEKRKIFDHSDGEYVEFEEV